ncbi:PA14 domain-containing protein [Terracidiphilus gabretensis]|uniref:PA14 domain-containing protein n=1 Tax=Terracidiphilus gabretensis TaxID=1577687 RepID=UPI0009E6740C|nr:PA14 domain-containing protein [Terracidiphilus gabretensis]
MRIVLSARVVRRSVLVLSLCFVAAAAVGGRAQQSPGAAAQSPEGESAPAVLRITTREVLVDVVATDDRNRPIRDLTAQEIEIVELKAGGQKVATGIASFRPTDAALDNAQPAPQSGGFRVSLGGDCAARATFHYEISFHPNEEGWQSGYHEIEVRTTRKGVKLAYHNRYYVGAKDALAVLPSRAEEATTLQAAACYHADVPPSIGLSARSVSTGLKDVLRYFVTVDADSLKFISVSFGSQRVQLDYGACIFNAQGRPIRYFSSAADRMLSSSEYAQAIVHGFPNLLEFPRVDEAVLMRVVVRDRTTGNVGTTTIPLAQAAATVQKASVDRTHDEQMVRKIALEQMELRDRYHPSTTNTGASVPAPWFRPPPGPIGSFGSIISRPNSFCGDVYDLPKNTVSLPVYWNLSSIGSLYTPSLDVPHQTFDNSGGIAGITPNTAWIGIDYHAMFWVKDAGEYEFRLLVDDGAILWIDDRKVIEMDGVNSGRMSSGRIVLSEGEHSMHVPYIQGPPTDVGLVVAIRPPGEKNFRIFDLREFAPPDEKSGGATAAQ